MYIRPDSAVVRSQEAITASKAPQQKAAEQEERPHAVAELPKEPKVDKAAEDRPLPKVRPRAVVRFSRNQQVYTVHYHEYDGGGALPDVAPIKDEPRASQSRGGRLLGSLVRERPGAEEGSDKKAAARADTPASPQEEFQCCCSHL